MFVFLVGVFVLFHFVNRGFRLFMYKYIDNIIIDAIILHIKEHINSVLNFFVDLVFVLWYNDKCMEIIVCSGGH